MNYGTFDDANRAYVVSNPLTPRPWINYLGNGKLQAFISQQAGGMMWYLEPSRRRLTRYNYIASPSDRPGYYVYVKDRKTGKVWNPHFGPTCTPLDEYECRHGPGLTQATGRKDGVRVSVDYLIPLGDDCLVWRVTAANLGSTPADLRFSSYLEFSHLEPAREMWWAYQQRAVSFFYNAAARTVRYDYHPYEAFHAPRMVVGCSAEVSGFETSREAFLGKTGHLADPEALRDRGFTGTELPIGGHGCGALATDMKLMPGESRQFAYVYALAETWEQAEAMVAKYGDMRAVDAAIAAMRQHWDERLNRLQVRTGDEMVDRFVNVWNPYQAMVLNQLPCAISGEHMGQTGMLYRDMTQYALAAANTDPAAVAARMKLIFSYQHPDGMGPCAFYPWGGKPSEDEPRRSDNTVWQIYTVKNLVCETGDYSYLDQKVPFDDGSTATVYEHILRGLKYLERHRGPTGLPLMYYADWNDNLCYFRGEHVETVMLGMQLVYSLKGFARLAQRTGREDDAAWAARLGEELSGILNSDKVWDGQWYRRLLLGGGRYLGGKDNPFGRIWLNTQTWSVISGVGDHLGRGALAMEQVHKHLDSAAGLVKQWPPVGGAEDPDREKRGTIPGIGENGGVFNHTQTWSIMAEALLGHPERAFEYYRRCLPGALVERFGADHYLREPYCYVSSVVGPVHPLFGQGGISWITGTASWMYVAATQYVLGIRPTLDGLSIRPALPKHLSKVRVARHFRGCEYDIQIDNAQRGTVTLEMDGKTIEGNLVPVSRKARCTVHCAC